MTQEPRKAVSDMWNGRYTPRPIIMAGMPSQYMTMPAIKPPANHGTLGMPETMVATTLACAATKLLSGPKASGP